MEKMFGAGLVLAVVLMLFYGAQFIDVLSSCDGAVVTTVNPLEPYACLPTSP